jgi:light-regulated signal transduction histidine kinase (bacteriophytochrome)
MPRSKSQLSSDLVTARNVDLSNCDRELIQYPAAVQGHGAMLIVDEPEFRILQASLNCKELIGVDAKDILGKTIADVFGARAPQILERMHRMELEYGPVHVVRESFAGSTQGVNIFAHRCDGVLVLELEAITSAAESASMHLYSDVRESVAKLEKTRGIRQFHDLAVERIRAFTGYDRVMAYKFAEDGSGHVVAEAKRDDLEPYLGLHYPATDIPAPARRLFGLSWLRHLPDVDYVPVPLIPDLHPKTGRPIDMSFSILRSVSVMYTGYLKNMGVRSTMVMPLMKEGVLWGLISAMHHSGPRHVPYEVRMAAEFLSHMVSLLMAGKEDAEFYETRFRMSTVADQLAEEARQDPDLHNSLGSQDRNLNLLSLLSAQGAAVHSRGRLSLIGQTPTSEQTADLVRWLADQNLPVMATDRLSELYPPAGKYKSVASGVLMTRLAAQTTEMLLWFRPEHIEIVNWAGDPKKPMQVSETDGEVRLQPRASFALWKQSVTGRSEPWRKDEREVAEDLQQALISSIASRAEEIERLNRQLAEANVELDSFAYAASHDLKEPLRGVHHLASFLKRGELGQLTEEGRQQLDTILKLTRRMDDLIESLLQYSRTGRTELSLQEADLDLLLDDALLACRTLIAFTASEIRRLAPLGTALCDATRLKQVFSNLISNAVKYNDKPTRIVEIGVEDGAQKRYFVRDNGIGIVDSAKEQIFEIFHRMHGQDEFGGGSGAGLTIARRTIERHGGRLWVESSVGNGSTFFFTLGPEASR